MTEGNFIVKNYILILFHLKKILIYIFFINNKHNFLLYKSKRLMYRNTNLCLNFDYSVQAGPAVGPLILGALPPQATGQLFDIQSPQTYFNFYAKFRPCV